MISTFTPAWLTSAPNLKNAVSSTLATWPQRGGSTTTSTATPVLTNATDDVLVQLGNCTASYCGQDDSLVVLLGGSAGNASNSTANTDTENDAVSGLLLLAVTSVTLGVLILATVVGNVFVIAAILLERNLQNVANYLIVSLAVADLMVACLVMPLGAVYEISNGWILGPELCDMWTSSDVLCCTASILHLVAIAMDRYWAVTNVDYIRSRNSSRIGTMIALVWAVALVVSLAPQFGWKDADHLYRITVEQRCLPSQDIAYQIFATCSTFYVPLLVILGLYWKIFQTARSRIQRRRAQRSAVAQGMNINNQVHTATAAILPAGAAVGVGVVCKRRFLRMRRCSSLDKERASKTSTLAILDAHSGASASASDDHAVSTGRTITKQDSEDGFYDEEATGGGALPGDTCLSVVAAGAVLTLPSSASEPARTDRGAELSVKQAVEMIKKNPMVSRKEKKESLEAKRERKAAKTLAIITGAFVVCWLPFFIMALLMPLCHSCEINAHMASFFLWLGYFNSTLNPVIYTVFSPEFRQAFKRILYGGHAGRRRRNLAGSAKDFRR